MLNKKTVLVGALLLSPATALSHPVQGPGAMSCAEFAKMYQADPRTEMMFYTWAQGYMSAINLAVIASHKAPRDLAGDMTDQKRAFRAYCADNPLKNYMDGIVPF
jgi:hypothetical protein